jgi:hypothetical protein
MGGGEWRVVSRSRGGAGGRPLPRFHDGGHSFVPASNVIIDLMPYIGDFWEVGYTRAGALPARSCHF